MRACKVCKERFEPRQSFQTWCSPEHGAQIARMVLDKRAKAEKVKEKRADRVKLDAMRTKPQLVALAQQAFNGFIRVRDASKTCISCGEPLQSARTGGAFDCGHYRSVGSAVHMRFVEDNAHGQCKHCNRHLAGNHVAYRMRLIERIGARSVDLIEMDQVLRKYSKEGLLEIGRHYRAETRKMQAAA